MFRSNYFNAYHWAANYFQPDAAGDTLVYVEVHFGGSANVIMAATRVVNSSTTAVIPSGLGGISFRA